jgi:hypothetical protein
MKKKISYLAIAATIAAAHSASATVISQVVTSAGETGATAITNSATLTSFVAGGTTYNSFIGIGVTDPTEPELLWANTLSTPGSSSAAVSDVNLATGALNNGTDAVYNLAGQALTAGTTIFMFGNGNGSVTVDAETGDATGSGGSTPFATVTFVDGAGSSLGTVAQDFFFQDPGVNTVRAPNLLSFDLTRGNGSALNGRTVSGAIFTLADITFTTGGIEDIAGFKISSGTSDIQDVGIAMVPEPATLSLIAIFGAGIFAARRFRV